MRSILVKAASAAVLFLASGIVAEAKYPDKDSLGVNSNIREYVDEVGFYQKANRDLGDPRFMWSDAQGKIDFGIGGMAKISTFYGFGGEAADNSFKPSSIAIPNDLSGRYSMSTDDTELHFKVRTEIHGHKVGAFIKIGANYDKEIKLKQAYISLDNFSIGLIPSFFTDLEVGVMTTGVGFSSQVGMTHPLLGYTFRPLDNLSIAAAIEWPELNLDHYDGVGIKTSYQPVPDLAGHIKFRWKKGHVQFGAVARNLTFDSVESDLRGGSEDILHHQHIFGYGLSLSGNYKPLHNLKLSWEFTGGHGYSNYLENLSDLNLDLGIHTILGSKYPTMLAIPAHSDQIAVQYDFSKSFSSSVVLSYTHCEERKHVTRYDDFCESYSALANLFWNIDDYSYIGFEYLFGTRKIYSGLNEPDFGHAHRIAAVLAYCF